MTEIDAHLAASLLRRFRLIRKLGQGGMGAVFLAEQIAVGNRPVALKVLSRKLLDDPEFLLRFQNEAASTGRIHHVNVVTIYESGQADDGTPYIAMEFLEGESLRQALARRGALSVPEVAEILQQAARGLNAAHKLGIIHRDLKPDNIFLTYPDDAAAPLAGAHDVVPTAHDVGVGLVPTLPVGIADTGRAQDPPLRAVVVKLVDFGIAKLRESGAHTQTGMVLGTPAYMSFEQASGMRSDELDARSDVYSLGVVVYEMLTGRLPFESDTPLGYLRKHMMEEPPPFGAVAPALGVPPAVESAVMRALAKDRDQRYASALDFVRAIVAVAQPASAPEVSQRLPSTKVIWPLEQPLPGRKGTTKVNPKDGLKYVWIPPGSFRMGCSPGDNECEDSEKPRHQVTITRGFWLGQTEVTVGAYKRFAVATGKDMPTAPDFNQGWTKEQMPMVMVSWHDAEAYCAWAGGRLPTEAEWEYAARAGSTEARYGSLDEVAWYVGNSGNQTHPVGEKRANRFGLYDTLGNVWEWVNDWADDKYYQSSPSHDPAGRARGRFLIARGDFLGARVLRGGCWNNDPTNVRVSKRFWLEPDNRFTTFGVRCGGEMFPP